MFCGGEDLSFSDAAVSFVRCLAISAPKEKIPEPSIDPSEVGDKVADAVALKVPLACRRPTLRVAASVLAMLTRMVILFESSLA